jgi:hypothetical protein
MTDFSMTGFSTADHAHEHAVPLDEMMEQDRSDMHAYENHQGKANQLMHAE